MKRVCCVITAVLLLCGFSLARAEDNLKIGCVDLQRVIETSDIGKKLKNDIQQEIEKAKQRLIEKDQELKKLGEMLDRQSFAMNDDVKQNKIKEYQTKVKERERMAADAEDDIKQKYSGKQQKLIQDVMDVVKQYGKEKGYSIILEKGLVVIYAIDSFNVTDEVIQIFNEKFSPKAPAEKPQPREKEKEAK
jgi:outer membrane protein